MMTEQENIKTASTLGRKISLYDKLHFRIISIVHETLYGLFVDPYPSLDAAGIGPGKIVLEVGSGPGFFTIPAAEIVGGEGRLHALDINPAAVRHVTKKVEQKGLKNVIVLQANASQTSLPDKSIDVAFLFGVVHALNDPGPVLREMHRVLKDTGLLSVQSHRWSKTRLSQAMTKGGLFRAVGGRGSVYRFEKTSQNGGR